MKFNTAIALIVSWSLCLSQLAAARDSARVHWEQYKRQYGKVYATPEEDARRFALFLVAREQVRKQPHTRALSHLSDWTEDEFGRLTGLRLGASPSQLAGRNSAQAEAFLQSILKAPTAVPAQLDWRQVSGRVGPVKQQGTCGSCWAFSTTGLLEGQQVARNLFEELVPLSEQNLVDCSLNDFGCDGGNMASALQDLVHEGGIASEQQYPYLAREGRCHFNLSDSMMDIKGHAVLPARDEETLQRVVARYGPVATAVAASKEWLHHKSGVIDEQLCAHEEYPNHGVLVVGYGTDPAQGDFWLVKNSWGADWGEQGYFRIKRGHATCLMGIFSVIATF